MNLNYDGEYSYVTFLEGFRLGVLDVRNSEALKKSSMFYESRLLNIDIYLPGMNHLTSRLLRSDGLPQSSKGNSEGSDTCVDFRYYCTEGQL